MLENGTQSRGLWMSGNQEVAEGEQNEANQQFNGEIFQSLFTFAETRLCIF